MYEEFYHLNAKPFRLSPDPEFFFASRGHKRALAYLRYGLMQDEGFVVITGAPGTGKTTLAKILLQEMDQSELVVAHLTTSQLDSDELLRMISASFGLRYDGVDKAGLLKTMEAFLLARARERKRALLVVDEAQNLPPKSLEELRMLSNLQVGEKALVQTFLLGQTQFRHMLDNPDLEQLQQRVIANYHLSELAEDECQSYIETRLQHVGWKGDPKITAAAYDGIYQYTQGIPRRINMLCDRLMLFGCLEERHEIDSSVLSDVTDELQQEISGKPIKKKKRTKNEVESIINSDPDSKKNGEEFPEEKSGSDYSDNDSSVEELETQDQHSAYSDIKDSAQQESIDEENIEELEILADEILNIENSREAHQSGQPVMAQQNNNERNNKDRFLIISGGRDEKQAGNDTSHIPASRSASQDSVRSANKSVSGNKSTAPEVSGDSDEVILRKILRLVLAYHRSPRSFPGLDDSTQLLPNGIKQILTLAVSDDETLKNLRQISVMGISPSMLRAAVRFFVRRVMFLPGGDDYRVLGLHTDATRAQIEEHYGLLMRLMRQEKKGTEESGVTRIGVSYERLCQSEITHVPDEPTESERNQSTDEEDELDLDLAPNIGGYDSKRKRVDLDSNPVPEVITGGRSTAHLGRNIVLVAGVLVIVFTLYLTQIKSTVEPGSINNQALVTPDQQLPASGIMDSASSQEEQTVESVDNTSSEIDEESRQRILAELRAESDAREKAIKEAEESARIKLEAEIRKAKQALATAEAEAKQESQARVRAEAAAQAALEAKAIAEAKTNAALKEQQLALKAKQDEANAQAKAEVAAKLAAANKKQAVIVKPQAKPENSKSRELEVFVKTLEDTYAAGDLEGFSKLFTANARTNEQTDLAGVRKDYKTFFESTSSRQITLSNLVWKLDQNYARGIGDYGLVTRSKGTSQETESSGKVTIQLEGDTGKRLQITRLYFTEASKKTKQSAVVRASIEELNKTLESFASAYKEGDIEKFMALFSPDAKTNDRSTLQGIRGDYFELFANTETRRLDYSSMQWEWKGEVANGTGSYVVSVQPKGKDDTDIYRGKLQFNVGRYGEKFLISKFSFE